MNIKNVKVNFKFLGKIENYLNENGPTVAMIGGLLCLAGSIYSAFKAAPEIAEVKQEYEAEVHEIESRTSRVDSNGFEEQNKKTAKLMRNVKYVLAYKWALIFGFGSAGFMILSNYLSGAKLAGVTAALALSQDKLKNLTERAKEMIGEEKFKEIEDKSLEDLVMQNFVKEDGNLSILPDHRKGQIFLDTDTGALFQMKKEDLLLCIERAEDYCSRNHGLNREKWFDILGFEDAPTSSKSRWWGPKNPFKVHIGNRMVLGMSVESLEYDHIPQTAKSAGCPFAA